LGAYIGTDFPFALDSPELDRFYEKVVDLNTPLFFHPAPAGIDGPKGDPKLDRFDLDLLAGFAAQETLALATLIYGGVMDRHPDLDICISHAGGAVPFLIGRMALAPTLRKWAPDALKTEGAFEERLSKVWFDTHVHDDRALDLLIDVVGTDRLVFGTNFSGWDQGEVHIRDDGRYDLAANARKLLRAN
jgi:aminocarboxymuconate-semialdehyde decarboxylase